MNYIKKQSDSRESSSIENLKPSRTTLLNVGQNPESRLYGTKWLCQKMIMSRLLRYFTPGQIYFITSVTQNRQPVLIDNFEFLKTAIEETKHKTPFELIAWAALPDHFHIIIDPGENNPSNIIRRIKLSFSHKYRLNHKIFSIKLWQSRFWDHIIRDQADMNRHINYIHYNPVKHGFAQNPFDWPYSSIHDFLKVGYYSNEWEGMKELDDYKLYGE